MPYFVDLYANPIFRSGEIKLLGIDVDEKNADSGPNFIKSHGMSWPHLEDTDSRSKLVFGPGVPVTYFLDKSGEVIHKHIGAYRSKSQLFEAVEKVDAGRIYLQSFIEKFTLSNRGKAFYTGLQGLGEMIFHDYENNRKNIRSQCQSHPKYWRRCLQSQTGCSF